MATLCTKSGVIILQFYLYRCPQKGERDVVEHQSLEAAGAPPDTYYGLCPCPSNPGAGSRSGLAFNCVLRKLFMVVHS